MEGIGEPRQRLRGFFNLVPEKAGEANVLPSGRNILRPYKGRGKI